MKAIQVQRTGESQCPAAHGFASNPWSSHDPPCSFFYCGCFLHSWWIAEFVRHSDIAETRHAWLIGLLRCKFLWCRKEGRRRVEKKWDVETPVTHCQHNQRTRWRLQVIVLYNDPPSYAWSCWVTSTCTEISHMQIRWRYPMYTNWLYYTTRNFFSFRKSCGNCKFRVPTELFSFHLPLEDFSLTATGVLEYRSRFLRHLPLHSVGRHADY